LVQAGRAGSLELERFYREQLNRIKVRREKISERISARPALTPEAQVRYYSSWIFAAVHILLSIPEFHNPKRIAEHLHLPAAVVADALEFLSEVGLAVRNKRGFSIGEARIHLPAHSPVISKHHINWRMQAIQALDRQQPEDLHYSLVMSLSRQDVEKLRNLILSAVESAEKIFRPSPEEVTRCLSIDLFEF
jgi:hypothetical protein